MNELNITFQQRVPFLIVVSPFGHISFRHEMSSDGYTSQHLLGMELIEGQQPGQPTTVLFVGDTVDSMERPPLIRSRRAFVSGLLIPEGIIRPFELSGWSFSTLPFHLGNVSQPSLLGESQSLPKWAYCMIGVLGGIPMLVCVAVVLLTIRKRGRETDFSDLSHVDDCFIA